MQLAAQDLTVGLAPGWEGRIMRRAGTAAGERTHPVLHLATFALPEQRGDFGGNAVDLMGPDDAFVSLFEYGPESIGSPLFASESMPRRLAPSDFSPRRLQRGIPGQTGCQLFFTEGGRPFCLYVVLGDRRRIASVLPRVNAALAGVAVGRRA